MALVVLLGKQEHATTVRLEEIASVVKPRGVPIMVDAASEHIERPSPWLPPEPNLDEYYLKNVIGGPGAFLIVAEDFNSFHTAILQKLIREIASLPIPQDVAALAE